MSTLISSDPNIIQGCERLGSIMWKLQSTQRCADFFFPILRKAKSSEKDEWNFAFGVKEDPASHKKHDSQLKFW